MAVAALCAAPVLAQQAAPGVNSDNTASSEGGLEEVVVTGFRASVNAAQDEKRSASGVIDAIKAEDIADFPDNNLAESIQRIPGVAISRDGGSPSSAIRYKRPLRSIAPTAIATRGTIAPTIASR